MFLFLLYFLFGYDDIIIPFIYTIILSFIWHLLRTVMIMCNYNDQGFFSDLIRTKYNMNKQLLKNRNHVHGQLGFFHATFVVIATIIILGIDSPEWLTNLIHSGTIPMNNYFNSESLLLFSNAYFLSDLYVIQDFPVYYLHHIITICLIVTGYIYRYTEGIPILILGLAELGGVALNLYNFFPDIWAVYLIFILIYSFSRFFLGYAMLKTCNNLIESLFGIGIFIQNIWFLSHHIKKFPRKWREGKTLFGFRTQIKEWFNI